MLKFDDAEVMKDIDNVLRTIEQYIVEYKKNSADE